MQVVGRAANVVTTVVSVGALLGAGLIAGMGAAQAAECPDVQVLFARGTGEAPGVGPTGQAFVDGLRSRVAPRSYDVYAVNYPATNEWSTGADGIRDAATHIETMVQTCPKTKMVLGGYSQGAAIMGFVTSAQVPDGVDPATVPKPLAPEIADHVAAVVLYSVPNVRAMNFLGEPAVVIGPTYQDKTLKVCAPEDAVCSDGLNFAAHDTYATNGAFINQGVEFAAQRLGLPALPPPPPPANWDQAPPPAP